MNPKTKKKFMADVEKVLINNIGKYGADLYFEHYASLEPKQIFESLESLLREIVGPSNTKKQLKQLKNKYERIHD